MSAIYLDYQASTPIDNRVIDKMLPYMREHFGNPHSSEHSFGWESEKAVSLAYSQLSQYIGSFESEIVFTSGATESNNLAIIGTAYSALQKSIKKNVILVSEIEHKCVLGAARFLKDKGFVVKKIPVKSDGVINIDELKSFIRPEVLLVSVMTTNNEIGTNQPIAEIGKLCRENDIIFHTDAAQGGYTNLDVVENNIDLMSLSSHKIYGPKGIGALFINNDSILKPTPIIYGGGQQSGYRSGTIPTFLAVGFGEAADIMLKEKGEEIKKLEFLREKLINGLLSNIPEIKINGNMNNRHPGNLNLLFPGVESKQLIYTLQPKIAFSTGSACTSGIIEPSHVLKSIGLSTEEAEHSARITVGRNTILDEINQAIDAITNVIKS